MKKVLVTGGAGFIGSHLCDYLLAEGHFVFCLDSLFSGRKENIQHNLNNPNFKFIKADISLPLNLKIEQLDEIYNLACPASPVQYQFDPIKTLNTSVIGVQQMLELARKTGAKILQASTSEIYGDPLEHPQKESYWGNVDTLGERACYDEGKRSAETLCKDYYQQYGVKAKIVRIFNVYGPRMMFNDGRVISNFILQALLGDDITVHGTGEQTRSFCYIDDFIKALVGWMDHSTNYQPVNIGNPDERSMQNLSETIKQLSNSASNIVNIPYQEVPGRFGDVKQRRADITKITQELGWQPETDLNEGLKKCIADFKNRLQNKPRIVVFTPAYLPLAGPAEKATAEVIKRLPGWEFDIITARLDKNLPAVSKEGSVNIYRLGNGTKMDKYLLPLRAANLAVKLNKKNNYRLAWSIMASYGALAAILFFIRKRIPFLLSVFEGDLSAKINQRPAFFGWLIKLIFTRASRSQLVAKMDQKQMSWLEQQSNAQIVNIENDWELLAKRTKEMFQELEILSSRL